MMQTYAEYKDSGVDWLGEIPTEWDVKPGMVAFTENKRNNKGMKQDQVLSLSYGNIIIKPKEKLVGLVPESFETYQIIEAGDIIIRGTDLQNDKTSLRTGLAKDDGIITSAYLSLRVRPNFSSRFLHYYLHTLDTSKVIYKYGSGLRQNLSFEDFKRLPVFDIPLPEQTAIAGFLDEKTAKIDELVGIKRRQIALLGERKQILIQNAVTKGLNPNAPLKDSGVDWIGNIPAHWEVKPLKRVMSSTTGFAFPSTVFCDDGIPLIRIGDLSADGRVTLDKCAKLPIRFGNYLEGYGLKKGDILMAMTGGTIGKTSYYSDTQNALLNQRVCRFIPNVKCFSEQLALFWMKTKIWKDHIDLEAAGGAQPNISDATVLEMLIALSPDLSEQNKIAAFIEKQSNKINAAITIKQNQITKLNEYKTTLINAAVTGKIKVA